LGEHTTKHSELRRLSSSTGLWIALILLLGLSVTLFVHYYGPSFVIRQTESRLSEQLKNPVRINASQTRLEFFPPALSFDSLQIGYPTETVFSAQEVTIRLSDVHIIHPRSSALDLSIAHGWIAFDDSLLYDLRSLSTGSNKLRLSQLRLTDFEVSHTGYEGRAQRQLIKGVVTDFELQNIGNANPILSQLALRDLRYMPANHPYLFRLNSLQLADSNRIQLNEYDIHPTLDRDEVTKFYGVEKDHYKISGSKISVETDLSFFKTIQRISQSLNAANQDDSIPRALFTELYITQPNIDIYRDNRPPFPPNHQGFWPMHSLRSLDIPLIINEVQISQASLSYKQQDPLREQAGMIRFSPLNVTLSNVRTGPAAYHADEVMTADFDTKVYEQAPLQLTMRMPYADDGAHQITGQLAESDMTAFSLMSEPCKRVAITQGRVDSLSFDMQLGDDVASGSVQAAYHDLKVSFQRSNSGNRKGLPPKLKSLLANALVLKSNAADSGRIVQNHDTTRSVFYYWWNSLLSGLTDILR
jgi:hypothetical protein